MNTNVVPLDAVAALRRVRFRVRQIEQSVRLAVAALRDEAIAPKKRMETAEHFLTMFVSVDDYQQATEDGDEFETTGD
jgi:hypothetical protein